MARISLRDYNREIEELIDSGQTDEAIAHCRYILETYPKHIHTYRSLGKALLESQRYGDAADVFTRVLACIPDDFIAHLGMSIIREDEGDLDGSIWHMERAFEVQPSNAAVQSELRRLYGRRDGLTPAKVQLTRGAMARMSAKSHLYSQAIAELRTALADDPQRPDLQVLLARMYTQAGQRLATIETCNALLGKFPYCLEANRLMVEILPGTERASDADTYRRRLEELDPYESHLSPAALTAEQVQAVAVTLERLNYLDVEEPIELKPDQPEWASSLGVSIDQAHPNEEPLPDWLTALQESPSTSEKAGNKEAVPDTEIPDWMREAGWVPASDETHESLPGIESPDEVHLGSGEQAGYEIPDWLQDLTSEVEPSIETPLASESADLSDEAKGVVILAAGLSDSHTGEEAHVSNEQLPGEVEAPPLAEEGETQAAGIIGETDSLLSGTEGAVILGASLAAGAVLSGGEDELQETKIEEPAPLEPTSESAGEELPDWLVPPAVESEMPIESEAIPDWLVSPPPELEKSEIETELPDSLARSEKPVSGIEVAGLAVAATEASELIDKGETPLSDELESEVPALPPDEGVPLGVSAWLAESATETPSELPSGDIEEVSQIEGVPEWLAMLSPETTTETGAAFVSDEVDQDTNLAQAEIPQWLREMQGGLSGETEEVADVETPQQHPTETEETRFAAGEVPDWLKTAMVVESTAEEIKPLLGESKPIEAPLIEGDTKPVQIHAAEVETIIEEPVEVTSSEAEQIFEEVAIEEIEQGEEFEPEGISKVVVAAAVKEAAQPDETAAQSFENEDEAMAWLESLAARQGAQEEELLTSPEERPAETPEWIQQFAEEPIEAGVQPDEIPQEERSTEDISGIAGLAGVAAAGLVAKHVLDEEVTEEPVAVTPPPPVWLPEEPVAETVQLEPNIEQVESFAEEGLVPETELVGETGLVGEEEVELPEWLRGIEAEAVAPTPEIVSGEWEPPAAFTTIETAVQRAEEAPQLDINSASLTQLERVPGVGYIIAQSIVAYREVNGPFTSLDQLQEIPGITPETSEELKRNLVIQLSEEITPPLPKIPDLEQAWQNIANGNVSTAVDQYSYFIRQEQHVDEIITQIQEAVIIYPLDPLLYQTLGDAYLRSDRLQEALEAYNRAEDLIK